MLEGVYPGSFWLFAGIGLLVMVLGATWVIQSRIVTCKEEHRVKFHRRLVGSGYLVMIVGMAYFLLSVWMLGSN